MRQLPILEGQMRLADAETALPAPRRRRAWYVVLIFCFFAAVIPETLATTSTSVAKIVTQPASLPFIMLFYGLADLLIREALVRRRLGWVSLIALGIAFGFMNEGVLAGTWYTVRYNGYAYVGQINYAWAVALTVFHVFVSVIAPIAFIETIFPSRAALPLLRRRGIIISSVVFLLLTTVFLFVESYRPYRIIVFALALTLAIIALRLPAARQRTLSATPPPSLWRLRWAGFFTMLGFFVLIYAIPPIILKLAGVHVVAAQVADIIIFVLFSALLLFAGRRWTGRSGWSLRHTLALIAGVLAFPSLLTVALPFFWPTLEFFATVPCFVLLILLDRGLKRRERAQAVSTGAETSQAIMS
ncbi:MAG TPA: hypothetical protein VGF38_10270 [Ktedonobacterales bacterium]|jgi:hypothetical protein